MKQHNSALRHMSAQLRVVPFQLARMHGAVSIEYALIASLIALVIIVGFIVLGTSLGVLYGRLVACFVSPASCLGGL
ncbi:MAG: Flp family type IVb pilin [Burkholderiaceae bacterium]|nr:Flp family type IVb pilin [Burkholderiaceae bacterium]